GGRAAGPDAPGAQPGGAGRLLHPGGPLARADRRPPDQRRRADPVHGDGRPRRVGVSSFISMSKTRILIIEDEPAIAEGIAYNLRREGYEVTHARDGETGLA